MYILKNAWISIKRNVGRNVLVGVIILLIACAVTVSLAIKNTSADLIDSYENSYDKTATISFDRSSMKDRFDFGSEDGRKDAQEEFSNMSAVSLEDIESYAESDHVIGLYYTASVGLDGKNIDPVSEEYDSSERSGFGSPKGGTMEVSSTEFALIGYSSLSAMSEFIDGSYKMSDILDDAWSIAFDGNYVFINEELASQNGLEVGDEITLKSDGSTYTFEIIGIYTDESSEEGMPTSMFSQSANTIITNAEAVNAISSSDSAVTSNINATFLIDSYDNIEEIQDAFYEKGLSTSYVLETNEEVASSGVSSIKNVKSFATTFLVMTLILGASILFVINMINIRERKYEIGVYRTIGMSKPALTFQFILELCIVAVVSLLVGAGIGAQISKPVSNNLLQSEITSSQSESENMRENFGGKDFKGDIGGGKGLSITSKTISAYDSIDALVDGKVVVELLGIGIVLVLVSSIASMVSIQRFSPLTILKERS